MACVSCVTSAFGVRERKWTWG